MFPYFKDLLCQNGLTWSNEIWYDNTYGRVVCFQGVSYAPILRGGAPAYPEFLGPPTCEHTVRETTTKFCTLIKLDVRKIFTGRSQMPTCDLFAIDNLVFIEHTVD